MDKPKLQAYADVLAVTGKYTKDGKERNRYAKCGVLLASPHFSHLVIKLDTVPVGGNGFLSVKVREGMEHLKPKDDEVGEWLNQGEQVDEEVTF